MGVLVTETLAMGDRPPYVACYAMKWSARSVYEFQCACRAYGSAHPPERVEGAAEADDEGTATALMPAPRRRGNRREACALPDLSGFLKRMASRIRPESIQALYAAKSMDELWAAEGIVPPPRPELQFRRLPRNWRVQHDKDAVRVHNERFGEFVEFRGSLAKDPDGLKDVLEIAGWRFGQVLSSSEGHCDVEGRFGQVSIRGPEGIEVTLWSIVREGHDSFEAAWFSSGPREDRFNEVQEIVFSALPNEKSFAPQAQAILMLIRSNFERDGAHETCAIFQTTERVGNGRKVKSAPCPLRDLSQHAAITELVRWQRKELGAVMVGLVGQVTDDDGKEVVLVHLETARERNSFWMGVAEKADGTSTLEWATKMDRNPWRISDLFAAGTPPRRGRG